MGAGLRCLSQISLDEEICNREFKTPVIPPYQPTLLLTLSLSDYPGLSRIQAESPGKGSKFLKLNHQKSPGYEGKR